MSINRETVEYVAKLSRIELQANELDKLSRQLQTILDFIDRLKKLDVEGVAATSHILPINNIFKADTPADSLGSEKTLLNAPEKKESFFVVPKIIE